LVKELLSKVKINWVTCLFLNTNVLHAYDEYPADFKRLWVEIRK